MIHQLNIETSLNMQGSNITIKDLVHKAKSLSLTTLGVTDQKTYSYIQLYKECIKQNIKPIFGLTASLKLTDSDFSSRVIFYASNNQGYKNILKIATKESISEHLEISELKSFNEGITLIIDSSKTELESIYKTDPKKALQVFDSLKDTYQKVFLTVSSVSEMCSVLNQKELIVLPKVAYLEKDDYDVHKTLGHIFNLEVEDTVEEKLYLRTEKELLKQYKDYPDAIKNNELLAKECTVTLDFSKTYLPTYPLKQNVTSKDYLRALVFKGLDKRLREKKKDKKVYIQRINYELDVIHTMGYDDYFLIVWDFVKYAKNKGYLVGPGRGSAAASLVSYCLGITNVDSLEYDLVFERFLNPERITLPDIDMDLPDDKRDDIISYVRDFYGLNKVASIATYGTFQMKSAVRDTARVLNMEGLLVEQISKETDSYSSINEMIQESKTIQNMMAKDESANTVLTLASKIEGLHRHVSTHAAGIIVTGDLLWDHTALQPGLLDMMQTQFEAKDLETLGLLKIDFLGLRNLNSIQQIVDLIEKTNKKKINIYQIPLDDEPTFKLLQEVRTTGIFQLESAGMRSLIGKMQIQSFDDIVTILALFRPGPMENIPSYLKRRFKEEKVEYSHPILKEILESTNGIIIYQEQIIKIASVFAGYALGEADLLRRAVSKKQEDVLQKERQNFVDKSTKQGHDEKTSNEIYDYIVKFANYGFNKAHSVAYAMVSYWLAYLKANYPREFISVLTSSVIGSERQMKNYIYEANSLGIEVQKPSINQSIDIFLPKNEALIYPLLGIKNVGNVLVRSLLEERNQNGEYTSFFMFVKRTQSFINKRVYQSLIYAHALDEFGYSKHTMIEKLDEVISFIQYGGFINQKEFLIEQLEEYPFETLQDYEKQAFGFNLWMNPLMEFSTYIKKHDLLKPSTIDETSNKDFRMVAIVSQIKKITTKKGQDMAFLTLEDEITKIDAVLFPNTYFEVSDILSKNQVYLLKGKLEVRNKSVQFVVDKMHILSK